MASVSDILSYARVLAKTDSNGLTNANGTAFINDTLYDMRRKMQGKYEDLYVQEATRSITATELDTGSTPGKFLFPSDMWSLKNIEVNLTDVTNQNLYIEAMQVDSSNTPANASLDYLRKNQPAANPMFDFRGDWFEIVPTPTSSMNNGTIPMNAAIKIFYLLGPTDVNLLTDTLAFPETFDFRIISYKVAAIYLSTIGSPQADVFDKTYNDKIHQLIDVVGSGEQSPIKTQGIRLTGWEY